MNHHEANKKYNYVSSILYKYIFYIFGISIKMSSPPFNGPGSGAQ